MGDGHAKFWLQESWKNQEQGKWLLKSIFLKQASHSIIYLADSFFKRKGNSSRILLEWEERDNWQSLRSCTWFHDAFGPLNSCFVNAYEFLSLFHLLLSFFSLYFFCSAEFCLWEDLNISFNLLWNFVNLLTCFVSRGQVEQSMPYCFLTYSSFQERHLCLTSSFQSLPYYW